MSIRDDLIEIGTYRVRTQECRCKLCRELEAEIALQENGEVVMYHWKCLERREAGRGFIVELVWSSLTDQTRPRPEIISGEQPKLFT